MDPARRWAPPGACLSSVLVGALSAIVSSSALSAQMRASERATVSQRVDGTELILEYHRPSVRGRDIFGSQVPWGEVWTPGANAATTLEVDKDIEIEGQPVPAGRYSVWMVVDPGAWEVVLDPRAELYHTAHPEPTDEQIRFAVTPRASATSMETLVFYFPRVRATGADLRMHWATTVVDLAITVIPTRRTTLTAAEAAPYTGAWNAAVPGGDGSADRHTYVLELVFDHERLTGRLEWGPSGEPFDVALAPVAEQVFRPIWIINGELAEAMESALMEFVVDESGRAVSFELRGDNDSLWMRGSRASND